LDVKPNGGWGFIPDTTDSMKITWPAAEIDIRQLPVLTSQAITSISRDAIGAWAQPAIALLVEAGIFSGYDDG